jgi:hypothetical protein
MLRLAACLALCCAGFAGAQELPGRSTEALTETLEKRQARVETSDLLNAMQAVEAHGRLVPGDSRTRCYVDFGDVARLGAAPTLGEALRRAVADHPEGEALADWLAGPFFDLQLRLQQIERAALWQALRALEQFLHRMSAVPEQEARQMQAWHALLQRLLALNETYRREVERLYRRQDPGMTAAAQSLLARWGGRLDWQGLRRDAAASAAELRRLRDLAATGPPAILPSEAFVDFYFRTRCRP